MAIYLNFFYSLLKLATNSFHLFFSLTDLRKKCESIHTQTHRYRDTETDTQKRTHTYHTIPHTSHTHQDEKADVAVYTVAPSCLFSGW